MPSRPRSAGTVQCHGQVSSSGGVLGSSENAFYGCGMANRPWHARCARDPRRRQDSEIGGGARDALSFEWGVSGCRPASNRHRREVAPRHVRRRGVRIALRSRCKRETCSLTTEFVGTRVVRSHARVHAPLRVRPRGRGACTCAAWRGRGDRHVACDRSAGVRAPARAGAVATLLARARRRRAAELAVLRFTRSVCAASRGIPGCRPDEAMSPGGASRIAGSA
jgi:hypothetical protein